MQYMIPLAVGGTVLSGVGQMSSAAATMAQGAGQQQASNYSAGVLRQQAGAVVGEAESKVPVIAQNTAYVQSQLRANAAGSGGSASAVTPVTIAGQIAARGEYNALSTLYSGQEKAAGLQNQANLDIYTGQQERSAARSKAMGMFASGLGSVLSGGMSLYSKYGMAPGAADLAASQNPEAGGSAPAGGLT